MKTMYATHRGYIKAKLIELGYPVEISKTYANGRGIRNLSKSIVRKEGIRIERQYYGFHHYSDVDEIIWIYTNNYIDKNKMKKIIDELIEKYSIDYRTAIYIY